MIKPAISILSISFLLFACNSTTPQEKVTTSSSKDSAAVQKENSASYEPTYFDYTNTRLTNSFSDTAWAQFSADTLEDCFTLFVAKGLITETQSQVRITTKRGEMIYEHIFPTSDLMNGYATEVIKTDGEMAKYILSEAKSLLSEGLIDPRNLSKDSYLSQALEEDFENYSVFIEAKKTGKVLFHYCLNEESHYYLGYSGKQKKAVTIIDCC